MFKALVKIFFGNIRRNIRLDLRSDLETNSVLLPADRISAIGTISGEQVNRAIKSLPKEIRPVIVLSILENFSYPEIAEIAGINKKIVGLMIYHGYMLIRRELFRSIALSNKESYD